MASLQGLSGLLSEISTVADYKKNMISDDSKSRRSSATETTGNSSMGSGNSAIATAPIVKKGVHKTASISGSSGAPIRRMKSLGGKESATSTSATTNKAGQNPPIRRSKSTADAALFSARKGPKPEPKAKITPGGAVVAIGGSIHIASKQQQGTGLDSSAAIYDVFDYSLSDVELSEGPTSDLPKSKEEKKKPKRRMKGTGNTKSRGERGTSSKLESVDEEKGEKFDRTKESPSMKKRTSGLKKVDSKNEATDATKKGGDFNDTLTSAYDVFDFSLSTVNPEIVAEESTRRRSDRRASLGAATGATETARTGHLSKEAQKAARERVSRASIQMKNQQQQENPRQRPGLKRSNSIGSTRELLIKKANPIAEENGPQQAIRKGGMNSLESPLGSSSHRRRGSSRRRGSMSNRTRQRPTLARSNSFGSVRDLTGGKHQAMDNSSSRNHHHHHNNNNAMKSPLQNRSTRGPRTSGRQSLTRVNATEEEETVDNGCSRNHHHTQNHNTMKSPLNNRSTRGPRTTRRQSLAHNNAANKQMIEMAVEHKNGEKDQNARTAQKWANVKSEFGAVANSLETSMQRALPSVKLSTSLTSGSAAVAGTDDGKPSKVENNNTGPSLQTFAQEMASLRNKVSGLSGLGSKKEKFRRSQSK